MKRYLEFTTIFVKALLAFTLVLGASCQDQDNEYSNVICSGAGSCSPQQIDIAAFEAFVKKIIEGREDRVEGREDRVEGREDRVEDLKFDIARSSLITALITTFDDDREANLKTLKAEIANTPETFNEGFIRNLQRLAGGGDLVKNLETHAARFTRDLAANSKSFDIPKVLETEIIAPAFAETAFILALGPYDFIADELKAIKDKLGKTPDKDLIEKLELLADEHEDDLVKALESLEDLATKLTPDFITILDAAATP